MASKGKDRKLTPDRKSRSVRNEPLARNPQPRARKSDKTTKKDDPLSDDNRALVGAPLKETKRKRDSANGTSRPTSKKTKVELTTTPNKTSSVALTSTTAADPAKDAIDDPLLSFPAGQFQTSSLTIASPTDERTNHEDVPLALPNFEWIEVSHTPETFLTRLQLRSFLLLFGHLAPRALNPRNMKYIQLKVFMDPNRMWTVQEMGKIMQILLSIVGEELVDLLKRRRNWNGDKILHEKRNVVKELMRMGFTEDMWEEFYELLYDMEDDQFGNSDESGGSIGRNRGRPTRRDPDESRNRRSNAAEPTVKYELLRQLLIISVSGTKVRQCLQENHTNARKVANATNTAGRTLKSELKAIVKEMKVQKKAGANEEAIGELEDMLKDTQTKISHLSLTEWLEKRKLDPRSSQPIGKDLLGNAYYLLPPYDGELVGYASWVLCQKGPELDHPLGEDWVPVEGDGGCSKEFYAIDGVKAVRELIEWIQKKARSRGAIDAGDLDNHTGASDCEVVLIGKLQQFAEMRQTSAR
ncbi:hypothetical protein TWF694_006754 [Orbilia ellipsospora]|uniref:WHIM1 domain-containing protein n=1 Tax=Orbilia ellipsospora TaxID=2528407 RepID=A0AAV9XL71_9PEZI